MINVVSSLEGWCTAEKAQRLYDLIKESNSMLTIELGVFGGRSLIPMAMAHRDKESGYIIGFDAWKASVAIGGTNSPANDVFWQNIDST